MNTSILADMSSLQEKLLGYVVQMSYQFSQLCIKADPVSLLGVEFEVDGQTKKIEDIANVIMHDKEDDNDKIDVVPKSNSYIDALCRGFALYFPEFSQSIECEGMTQEKMKEQKELKEKIEREYGVTIDDSQKNIYLRLTMPPVDDDRKDLIDKSVEAIHDATKLQMDAVSLYYTGTIKLKSLGEDEQTLEEINSNLDQIKSQYEECRETMTAEKLKEAADANRLYHQKQIENAADPGLISKAGQSLKME